MPDQKESAGSFGYRPNIKFLATRITSIYNFRIFGD